MTAPDSGLVEVRITVPDGEIAARIAATLVDERLAACVQIIPGVTSVYRWEGELESATEHLLLAKSTAAAFEGLRARVLDEHPYETPEILAVPVSQADGAYAAWLAASVTDPAGLPTDPAAPADPTTGRA